MRLSVPSSCLLHSVSPLFYWRSPATKIEVTQRALKRLEPRIMSEVKPRRRVFGGIVRWRNPQTNTYEYVVVKARRTAIYSFPKGHSHANELPMECALREIEEETGLSQLPAPTGHTKQGGSNLFFFDVPCKYPLKAKDMREVEDVRWYTLEEMETLRGNKGLMNYVERERNRQSRPPRIQQHQ
jgi:8-oxo-dGTP pyrophosphatase MutT (NUDIX family)